jgi:hypothetical protein
VGALVEQEEEALGGEREGVMVAELREINLYALTGGDVEEAATMGRSEFLPEHEPVPGEEAAVVVPAWVGTTPPPWLAHRTEADVVNDVVGEDALGENPRWPVSEIRPVPPTATVQHGLDHYKDRKQTKK